MTVQSFIKKYNGRGIEDCGAYTGDEFKTFAKDFRSMMNSIAKSIGAQLVGFRNGHYDVSGFLKRGEMYSYFSYSVPRGEFPIDCEEKNALRGILVRSADSELDFIGDVNMFCNFYELQKLLDFCL